MISHRLWIRRETVPFDQEEKKSSTHFSYTLVERRCSSQVSLYNTKLFRQHELTFVFSFLQCIGSSLVISSAIVLLLKNEELEFHRSANWRTNLHSAKRMVSSRLHKFVPHKMHLLSGRHPFRHGHVRFYYSSISTPTKKR